MPSYPASIYTRPDPIPALMSDIPTHSTILGNYGDEIEALEGTLGVNPQGAYATVAARLNALATSTGAYTAFTPTSLTQSGAVTYTVTRARYTQMGKTVFADVELAITGAGTNSNALVLRCAALPAALADTNAGGTFYFYDDSSGQRYTGSVIIDHTNMNLTFQADANAGVFGVSPGSAVANLDKISVNLRYEAA